MSRIFLVIAFAGLLIVAPSAYALTAQQKASIRFSESFVWFDHLKTPIDVSALVVEDARGRTRAVASFKGRYLLLNLWATWCPPCVEELPSLARLRTLRAGKDFDVLAVSVDRGMTGPRVDNYLQRKSIPGLPAYHDKSLNLHKKLSPGGLPTTYLIDRAGQIRFKMSGPARWHSKEGLAFIDSVIVKMDSLEKAENAYE